MLAIFCGTGRQAFFRADRSAATDRLKSIPFTDVATSSEAKEMQESRELVPDVDNQLPPLPLHVKELNWFDYLKYIFSTSITLGSIIVSVIGIYNGYYFLECSIPVSFVLLALSLTLLFYLEGLMVAIAGTQYWDRDMFKEDFPMAFSLHELVNRPHNVKRFMIGRQFCTVLMCYIMAEVTTFPGWPEYSQLGPVLHFLLFRSGLVGVFIVLSFGQLMPELLAAEYPLRFMNLPGSYTVVCISLFMESIGVGHCAWIVYSLLRSLMWT